MCLSMSSCCRMDAPPLFEIAYRCAVIDVQAWRNENTFVEASFDRSCGARRSEATMFHISGTRMRQFARFRGLAAGGSSNSSIAGAGAGV